MAAGVRALQRRAGQRLTPPAAAAAAAPAAPPPQRLRSPAPLFASDFPPELRAYGPSSHMPWHKDEQLYTVPQWECIYTVDNTSDRRVRACVLRVPERGVSACAPARRAGLDATSPPPRPPAAPPAARRSGATRRGG